MTFTCPKCRNKGEVGVNEGTAFEARGRNGSKIVLRCNKCHAGLMKGAMFGAKEIPDAQLRKMKAFWQERIGEEW